MLEDNIWLHIHSKSMPSDNILSTYVCMFHLRLLLHFTQQYYYYPPRKCLQAFFLQNLWFKCLEKLPLKPRSRMLAAAMRPDAKTSCSCRRRRIFWQLLSPPIQPSPCSLHGGPQYSSVKTCMPFLPPQHDFSLLVLWKQTVKGK